MSIETTETTGLGQRLSQSIGATVAFAVLALCMLGLLFWNEGRAVRTAQALEEGGGAVRSVSAAHIDPRHQGQLVHVTGPLRTSAPLVDPQLAVEVPGIRLERSVEMFQWVEEKTSEKSVALGGTETVRTHYQYRAQWKSSPQESSHFQQPAGHTNPAMRVERRVSVAPAATLGAWSLTPAVLQGVEGWQPWAVPAAQIKAAQAALQQWLDAQTKVHAVDGGLYLGPNPAQPQVGDYRIRYRYVPLDVVSIVARQSGQSLQPYPTRNGQSLLLTQSGAVPAEAMFATAQEGNAGMTWLVRIIGLVLLVSGINGMLRPLSVLASVVPWLASVVSLGTGTIAVVLGMVVGGATISIAWLVYRPGVALAVLLVGLALAGGMVGWKRRVRQSADAAAQGVLA